MREVVNVLCTKTRNIGDLQAGVLSSVKRSGRTVHITDVDNSLKDKIVICGGGGMFYPKYVPALEKIAAAKPAALIGWGIGTNTHGLLPRGPIAPYPSIVERFDLLGVRDARQRFQWTPCASCTSPLFDQYRDAAPAQWGVVYKHHQQGARLKGFAAKAGMEEMQNDQPSFEAVLAFLSSAAVVITDCYHGLYWATLLNRQVVVDAWSSKFCFFPYPVTPFGDFIRGGALRQANAGALVECRQAHGWFAANVDRLIQGVL